MSNGSEATSPDQAPWLRRPAPAANGGLAPSGDVDEVSWGDRFVVLAGVEDALRVHQSVRRPARRRSGSLESPVACHDLRSASPVGRPSAPSWPSRPPPPAAGSVTRAEPVPGVSIDDRRR